MQWPRGETWNKTTFPILKSYFWIWKGRQVSLTQEPDNIINHGTRSFTRTETPLIHSKVEMGRKLFPMSQNYLFVFIISFSHNRKPSVLWTREIRARKWAASYYSVVWCWGYWAWEVWMTFLAGQYPKVSTAGLLQGTPLTLSFESRPVRGIKYSPEHCSFHLLDAFQSHPTQRNHSCLRKLCRSWEDLI